MNAPVCESSGGIWVGWPGDTSKLKAQDVEKLEGQLRALRTAKGIVDDGVRVHSFLAQQRVFSSGYGVDRNYWKGHFVRELSDELIDVLLELADSRVRA